MSPNGLSGGLELAEEVTHDAYLKLAQGAWPERVEKPLGYCCQVVRNLALDHWRRRAQEAGIRLFTEDGEAPQVAGGCGPDKHLHERQVLQSLDQALASLPARTRHAFELYRLAGLTQREIGVQLGCSATLVNFMLKDAMVVVASCRHLLDEA